jgi:carboxylesterase type B
VRNRWKFTFVFVAVAVLASAAVAQHVLTESGTISGIRENGLSVYKGIPFASPPGGRLALARPGTCRTLDWHA